MHFSHSKSLARVILSSSSATQSTPLPARLLEHKAGLSKSERCLQACDLDISSKSPAHVRHSHAMQSCEKRITSALKGQRSSHRPSAGASAVGREEEVPFPAALPQGVDHLHQPGGQEPTPCKMDISYQWHRVRACVRACDSECFH